MSVDQPFRVGQRVRIIDFREDRRYASFPRTNPTRTVLIGQTAFIISITHQPWQYAKATEWCVRLTVGPDISWPITWITPVSYLASIVQRYKEELTYAR